MKEIPRELDWVKERATCTIRKMFAHLQLAVDEDIKSINQTRKFPEDSGFGTTMSNDGESFLVKRSEAIKPFVRFAIEGDCIKVSNDGGTLRLEYRITLSDEGRCQLTQNGTPLEQWQVRKMALEGLFFGS
jgi:hypothetical protein